MCGIVGFVGSPDPAGLAAMTQALAHRGPDGSGCYIDPVLGVHLGHRRLAIIDVADGAQPMWNEDEQIAAVFNGEIYNHLELRAELEGLGHRFRTDHSDTEVLVHGYEQWGEALPARLNGMFAFAIFDRPRKRLFLARDRFGEKPLYYAHRGRRFTFASELSALARQPGFDRTLDRRALQKFFAYGFMPAPHALYMGTAKLPGGCHLAYDIATGEARIERYWRFALEPDPALLAAEEGALAEELRALLFQAVRRRLISDVPLGVFLSGGIDSSAVLAGMAQAIPADRIESFTIGFTEPSFDESPFARAVARAFGSDHHEETLSLDAAKSLIESVLRRMDEPLADGSILPTYLLSRFTRSRVTVALSGDGGDELFAGYDPFEALAPAQFYSRIVPQGLHRGLRSLAELLPVADRNMSLDFKIRRTLAGLSYPAAMWNPVWMGPLEPAAIAELFDEPVSADELYGEAIDAWNVNPALDKLDRSLEYFTNFYLTDDILMKVDRATMMNSLESRAVFLDNDVVAFCRRLPNRFKLHRGQRKVLLKKAMEGVIPDDILARPKKGFGIPLAKWLRDVPETPPMGGLDGARLDWAAARWAAHRDGKADHRLFLWAWLSVQSALAPAQGPVAAAADMPAGAG